MKEQVLAGLEEMRKDIQGMVDESRNEFNEKTKRLEKYATEVDPTGHLLDELQK
jgi:hypothetical protein